MLKTTKLFLRALLLLVIPAVAVLYYSAAVFLQLFIAFALAYILNPPVVFLERRGVKRLFGIMILSSLAVVLCGCFADFLVASIVNEFLIMQLNLPAYVRHLCEITSPSINMALGVEAPDQFALLLNVLQQQSHSAAPDLLKPLLAMPVTAVLQVFLSSLADYYRRYAFFREG